MESQHHVLLLGDSVLMDSVAESLIDRNFSNVIRINSNIHEASEILKSFNPDLVVYELIEQNSDPVFTIICKQANSSHLVIDLNCNQVILLDSQRKSAESLQALCDLVSQEVNFKKLHIDDTSF